MFIELQVSSHKLIQHIHHLLQRQPICIPGVFSLKVDPLTMKPVEPPLQITVDHIDFPPLNDLVDYVRVVEGGILAREHVRYSSYRADSVPSLDIAPFPWKSATPDPWAGDVMDIAPTRFVHLGIPLTAFVQKVDNLGVSTPSSFNWVITGTVWVELTLSVDGAGGVTLYTHFAGLEGPLGEVPAELVSLVKPKIDEMLTPWALPLKFLQSRDSVREMIKLLHGVIATGHSLDFLAFRFECGPLDDSPYHAASNSDKDAARASWTKFYGGAVDRYLSQGDGRDAWKADWSLYIEGGLIGKVVAREMEVNLAGAGGVAVRERPIASWSDTAGLHIHTNIQLLGACPTIWGDTISPEVDVGVNCAFGAAARGLLEEIEHKDLEVTIDIERDMDNDDAWGCAINAAIIGALYGAEAGAATGTPYAAAIYSVYGFFAGLLVASYLESTTTRELPIPGDCVQTHKPEWLDTSEQHVCRYSPPGGDKVDDVDVALQRILSRAGGLCLAGVTAIPAATRPLPDLKLDAGVFTVEIADICDKDLTRPFFLSTIFAESNTPPAWRAPLKICSATVVADPASQFAGVRLDPDWSAPIIVAVPLELKPEYLAAPYDCQLVINSSGVARRVIIPRLSHLTDAERAALATRIHRERMVMCSDVRASFVGNGSTKLPDLPWDPPIDPRTLVISEIIVTGLDHGEQVTLSRGPTDGIATATVTPRGTVRIFALSEMPQQSDAPLMLRRDGPSGRQLGELRIRHTLLKPASDITLPGEPSGLFAGRADGVPALLATYEHGLNVYDLTRSDRPRLRHQVPWAGLRGAIVNGPRIVCWGQDGALSTTPGEGWRVRRVITNETVMDVVQLAQVTYLSQLLRRRRAGTPESLTTAIDAKVALPR